MSQDLKKEKSIKISHDNFSFFFFPLTLYGLNLPYIKIYVP